MPRHLGPGGGGGGTQYRHLGPPGPIIGGEKGGEGVAHMPI